MKRNVLIGIASVAVLGSALARADDAAGRAIAPSSPAVPLAQVNPSNGIDASEARAIADAYFVQEYGDCGGPDRLRRLGRTWIFSLVFGVSGRKLEESIKVDVKTGGVWAAGGPRYRTFEEFREKKEAREKQHDGVQVGTVRPGVAADERVGRCAPSRVCR